MWHKITIVGYLGGDPELRYMDTGVAVCNFSLAASRKYTRRDGREVDETAWFSVTVWGDQGENAYKFLKKGSPVLVEGRMSPDEKGNPRTFERNDGSWGARFEVTARDVRYLPSGGAGGKQPAEPLVAGGAVESKPPGETYAQYDGEENPAFLSSDDADDDDEGAYIF